MSAEAQIAHGGMVLLTGGIGCGVLLCAALVFLLSHDEGLAALFARAAAGGGAEEQRTLQDHFCVLNNPHVSLAEKSEALDRIVRSRDAQAVLLLTLSFARKHPLALRRRILAALRSLDAGERTEVLLIDVLSDRMHARQLRLDAAQRLLEAGSVKGAAAVKKVMRSAGEDGHMQASLLNLLAPELEPAHIPVLIAALRVPHMHVRGAALNAFKRINTAAGMRGGVLREQTAAALAHSIQQSRHPQGIRTRLRLLIEAEACSAAARPEERTAAALRRVLLLRPLDNPAIEDVAALAAEGAGRLGAKSLIPELKRAMYGPSDQLRNKAVASLRRLGASDLIPEMGFIADYDLLARIRRAAAQPLPQPS
ncbi:MAG: hypothetical protein ABIJ96_03185 [Elusimicrobiota bacterium]